MRIPVRFFHLIVKRDFNPIQGQKDSSLHFFQCRLPIWGSWIILFILCFTGIICLGVHGGIKHHLTILESNPFVSAIRIEGAFSREKLARLKSLLYFNTQTSVFETSKDPQPYHQKVIQAVYPFNLISLRFLDHTGTHILSDAFDVLSVKVQHPPDQVTEHADNDIKQWMANHLKKETFFEPYGDASVNYGVIVSETLYKQMGFEQPFEELSEQLQVSFLSTDAKFNLLEDRARDNQELWAPLSDAERMKYVVTAPLVNVAEHLPGGDAIISEGCYDVLTRGNYFSPCKR
ncbi:MAG: hypothetical protein HQK75_20800, partial [Candidatus Magnetomorum sp.]|nr:hypothetical protein [Candidatus Magnetomorum sp.]